MTLEDLHVQPIATKPEEVVTSSYRGLDYNEQKWHFGKLLKASNEGSSKGWKKVMTRNNRQAKGTGLEYGWLSQQKWHNYAMALYKPEKQNLALLPSLDDVDMIYYAFGGGKMLARRPREGDCPKHEDTTTDRFNWHSITHPRLTKKHHSGKIRDGAVYFLRKKMSSSPYNAFGNNTWVEVTHCGGSAFETFGVWHYAFRGSGLYVNIGKTIAFETHQVRLYNTRVVYKQIGHERLDLWSMVLPFVTDFGLALCALFT
jgi:hypothetical protein